MNIEEYTKEYILTDVEKLQYLFQLKQVIRYDEERSKEDFTESVAEHVYGMQLLCQYFLPLEDPENKLDREKIYEIITIHDVDEIETGDYLSYRKTDEHKQIAKEGFEKVKTKFPEIFSRKALALLDEYERQDSPESRFVKAIDKVEPLVHVYNEHGKKLCHQNRCTAEDSLGIKTKYIEHYPFIKKFTLTLHQVLIDGDYYWTADD